MGGRKEERKKGDKYQPQINELKNRLDKVSEEFRKRLESLEKAQLELEKALAGFKERIEEVSAQTQKNTELIKIFLRAQELLEAQEDKVKKTEEKLKSSVQPDNRTLKQEFEEVINDVKEGTLDFQKRGAATLVSVATFLVKEAAPSFQRTFWRLVEAVYECESGRGGASKSEIACALRAILGFTDLLKTMPKLKRGSSKSCFYFVFNEDSDFYKKFQALCCPLPPVR